MVAPDRSYGSRQDGEKSDFSDGIFLARKGCAYKFRRQRSPGEEKRNGGLK